MKRLATPTVSLALAISAVIVLFHAEPKAATPGLLTFQGVLYDSGGDPVTAATSVVFTVWDAENGGSALWAETLLVTPDAAGRMSQTLGEVNPVHHSVFSGTDRWLGIKIAADPEASPRGRLTASAYSMRVGTIDSADGGRIVGDVEVAGALGTAGSVGVGTLLPSSKLHVREDQDGITGMTIENRSAGTLSQERIDFVNEDGTAFISLNDDNFSPGASNMNIVNLMPGGGVVVATQAALTVVAPSDNDGIQLPDNTISAPELLDEPGIASTYNGAILNLTASLQPIDSVQITVPSAGYVMVTVTLSYSIDHVNGNVSAIRGSISASPTSLGSNFFLEEVPSNNPTESGIAGTLTSTDVFAVTAGANTYYVNAQLWQSPVQVHRSRVTAVFVPTAYGNVD